MKEIGGVEMEIYLPWIWMGLIVVFGVAEAMTAQLVSIWFVGGATVALFTSFATNNMYIQFTVFLAISAILLLFTRPVALKYISRKQYATNADMVIGEKAEVTTAFSKGKDGRVMVSGQSWSARSLSSFEEGQWCTITAIEGVTLIVKPLEEELC